MVCTSKGQRNRRALAIEELPVISEVLTAHGHPVQRYRPCEVNTGRTANITQRIKQGHFDILWTSTPNTRLIKKRWSAHLGTIMSYCLLMSGSGGHYFIYGPSNDAWNEPELAAMLRDLNGNVTTHQLCHFGLSLQPQGSDIRSRAQVRCVSNCGLPNSGCRCGSGHRHVMDWTSTELSFKPAQTKEQILASIAGALLSQLPDQTALEQAPDCKGTLNTKGILGTEGTLGTPTSMLSSSTAANAAGRDPPQRAKQDSDTRLEDTNSINPITPTAMQPHDASPLNAYPTEDRIRQKALEKVRKEMGVKAVKRVKHVEDHHDDCGESLEGLPPCPDQEDCHLADYAVDDDFDHTAHRVCYQCCELFASAPREPCNLQWAFQTLDCASGGIDVMEVCGGEGRPSYVAVRRQLSVGENII